MDPFTISATCIGLIAAIAQLSSQISTFADRVKDARKDMQEILQELGTLSANLAKMRDDRYMAEYPTSLRQNLLDTLKNCDEVTKQMGGVVQRLSAAKILGRFQWSLSKREKLMTLKAKLEGHKAAIAIALLVASIYLSVEVKDNTKKILHDTNAIKLETAQNAAQLTALYQCMGSLQLHIRDLQRCGDSAEGVVFQGVVDSTTTYTAAFADLTPERVSDEFFDAKEQLEARSGDSISRLSGYPDIIIAIDFGSTYTAVAWGDFRRGASTNPPQVIQTWPGNGSARADKVPTILGCQQDRCISWGYLVTHEEEDKTIQVYKNFKDKLDHGPIETLQPLPTNRPLQETKSGVEFLCHGFLENLYEHIHKTLEMCGPSLRGLQVEYAFSMPHTWSVEVIDKFEKVLKRVGFSGGAGEKGVISMLDEGEAAATFAVHDTPTKYSTGDTVLVVDSGSTRTKLTLLTVAEGSAQGPTFRHFDSAQDNVIGSGMVDLGFRQLLEKRLSYVEAELNNSNHSVEDIARELTETRFQIHKADFDYEDNSRSFRAKVPGLTKEFQSVEASITGGLLEIAQHEIKQLFDLELEKIVKLINSLLDTAVSRTPEFSLKHMVLCGGFSSSHYITKQLRRQYQQYGRHPCANRLETLICRDPGLAIVKGLIFSQARRRLALSGAVFQARIIRMSYGIVSNQLFNPHLHRDQEIFRDDHDGQVYARDQINWVIRGHAVLKDDFLAVPMTHGVAVGKPLTPWKHTIVVSQSPASQLPKHPGQAGATVICGVTCDFSTAPRVPRKRVSDRYEEIDYVIMIIFEPAGIRFQVELEGKSYDTAVLHMAS